MTEHHAAPVPFPEDMPRNVREAIMAAEEVLLTAVDGCEECARAMATRAIGAGGNALIAPWVAEVTKLSAELDDCRGRRKNGARTKGKGRP